MTTRLPVSSIQNKWVDAQRVDLSDMNTEQQHKNANDAAIVQNFFGSGVMLETPTPNIIFDTEPTKLGIIESALIAAGNFDGTGISPQAQPSDSQQGNQLAVELTDSAVFGRRPVKVLIIGLSFDGQLQYDRFEFHKNETQTTHRHYARVLTILFNNFQGNNNCSCFYGGRIVIRETLPYELNRDAKSVAQDVMPNIFIRDFRVADCTKTLYVVIQEGIGSEFDANNLRLNITGAQPARAIEALDVTTQIGQKFLAKSNNIQKVTLLLGATRDPDVDLENQYDWEGDLVVSIYPLQTTVNCPTDIIPNLAIDFEPDEKPLVEISYSQAELRSNGYVLTDIAQPVDFVFTNTKISQPGTIIPDRFYAVTIRRSGAANLGTIFAEKGSNRIENSRLTVFNGIWVDVPEEDLWFQIWSDAAKHATGQAYDRGNGIIAAKTGIDSRNGAVIDFGIRNLDFINTGQNIVNTGLVQATINKTITQQDEKTGENVFSRQQYVPTFSFVTNDTLNVIKQTSEPLIIGCMSDINPKITTSIEGTTEYPGLVKGDLFTILNPGADLLSLRLIGRKLIPSTDCPTKEYRIMRAELCTDGYGDVNGDGFITQEDVDLAASFINEDINDPATQQKIVDGYIDILQFLRADVDGDGVITVNDIDEIQSFVNRSSNSFTAGTSFTHLTIQVQPSVGRWDGYHDCCNNIIPLGSSIYCVEPLSVDPDTLTDVEKEYFGNHGVIPEIETDNTEFQQIPFLPIDFEIEYQSFWQEWLLSLSSKAREVPSSFTFPNSLTENGCEVPLTFDCTDRGSQNVSCDPGRNDFYVPGNLIIKEGGEIIRPNGDPLKSDIEVGIINLELPAEPFEETMIDIFRNFVADKGDLFTNAGYPAMKYSDCSTVQQEDLVLNKVRFNVSIQSFFPNFDGYSLLDGYGIIIDDIIGVYMNHENGVLSLTLKDLDYNPLFKTLVTKIQIIVYLKKAGWNNQILTIAPDQVWNLSVSP